MAVLRLLNLVQAIAASFADLPHTDGNVKAGAQVVAELFGQFGGAGAGDVHVLRHPRLVHVGVDGLAPNKTASSMSRRNSNTAR